MDKTAKVSYVRLTMKRILHSLVLLAALPAAGIAQADDEKILEFESRISINADATVIITETIKASGSGRGIRRDFPAAYKDHFGNTVKSGLQVLEALRDGRSEDYRIESTADGKRVYLGGKEDTLKPGVYVYTLKYAADRLISYSDDFDELYRNITGDQWGFVIENARAIVELPPGAYVVQQDAFTGRGNAKNQNVMIGADRQGNVTFAAAGPLQPGEGMTIAVAWPKGIVAAPGIGQKVTRALRDNSAILFGLAGLFFVFAYCLLRRDN